MSEAQLLFVEGAYQPDLSPNVLDQIRVLNTREGGLVEAMVPVSLIEREEVAVDENHVIELVTSIQREAALNDNSGQLSPVLLAEVPGRNKLAIIDGFHRDATLASRLGRTEYYATIRPGTSEETLVDLRILTAATHKSVSFARQVAWIEDAWAKSPWSNKISAAQAFTLTTFKDAMNGKKIGLSEEEVTQIRAWATDKCERWNVSTGTIMTHLSLAAVADPELISQARPRENGHTMEAVTPNHLRAIAVALPNLFLAQRLVSAVVVQNALTVPQARTIAKKVAGLTREEDIISYLENVRATSDVPRTYGKTRSYELKQQLARQNQDKAKVLESFLIDEVMLAKLALENLVLRGEYAVPKPSIKGSPLQGLPENIQTQLRTPQVMKSKAVDRLTEREHAVNERIAAAMSEQYGCSHVAGRHMVTEAAKRIRGDLMSGSLQYVRFTDPRQFDLLLAASARGIMEELTTQRVIRLDERRSVDDGINIGDLTSALPLLTHQERLAMVLSKVFRLTPSAIAQVIKCDLDMTSNILATAVETITA